MDKTLGESCERLVVVVVPVVLSASPGNCWALLAVYNPIGYKDEPRRTPPPPHVSHGLLVRCDAFGLSEAPPASSIDGVVGLPASL